MKVVGRNQVEDSMRIMASNQKQSENNNLSKNTSPIGK
jgi:hypothetical protein